MYAAALHASATALVLRAASSQYFLPPIPINGRTVNLPVGYVAILSHEISSSSLRVTFTASGGACYLYLGTAEPTCSGGYSISVPATACSFSPIASATGASPNSLSVYASDSYYGYGRFVFLEVADASAISGSNCTITYEYGRMATADLDPRIVAAVTVPTVFIVIAVFVGCAVYRQRKRRRSALVAAAAEEAATDGGTDDDEGDGGDGGTVHRQLVYTTSQPAPGGAATATAAPSGSSNAHSGLAPTAASPTARGATHSRAVNEDPV